MEKAKKIIVNVFKILIIVILVFLILRCLQFLGWISTPEDNVTYIHQDNDYEKFWEQSAQWYSATSTYKFVLGYIVNIFIYSLAIVTILLSFTKKKIKNKVILWIIGILTVMTLFIPVSKDSISTLGVESSFKINFFFQELFGLTK